MKIVLTRTGAESPVIPHPTRVIKSNPGVPDVHGAFSVEEFSYADDLKRTHEDAEGFLDYLENWYDKNFWYKDGNVKKWAFGETYDNWQDIYGVDAVLAAYLSSHGAMGGDGNFHACMGADWGGGHNAYSFDMRIGNEMANYIWWSCCESMRIRGGHDPIRTWSPASLGFRMMFGYETTSVDDGDYGSDFWDEWNEGKSLSTAFLDASWGISSDQIPVALAVGATKDEAINRVFNERMLEWGHVSDNWWWWRWYEKANPARRSPNTRLPAEPLIAILIRPQVDENFVSSVLKQHQLKVKLPSQVNANLRGTFYLRQRNLRMGFRGDGTYEIEFAKPNMKNVTPLKEEEAIRVAQNFIKERHLDQDLELTFDHIRYGKTGGATKDLKESARPQTVETTVEFTQVVNGIPVISQKRGKLRISMDNDRKVTRMQNDTRKIAGLSKHPRETYPGPNEKITMHDLDVHRRLLNLGWEKRLRVRKALNREVSEIKLIPNTDEIGYEVINNEMALCARGLVEVTMPGGYRKRYYVTHPIVK